MFFLIVVPKKGENLEDKVNRVLLKTSLEVKDVVEEVLEGLKKLTTMVETEQANRIVMEDPVLSMVPCNDEASLLAFLEVVVNSNESRLLMVCFPNLNMF